MTARRLVTPGGCADRTNDTDLKQRNPGYAQRQREQSAAWHAEHKDEVAVYRRRWERRQDPMVKRARELKRKYGLTPEGYEALFASQGHRCGLCGVSDAARWMIDHCHETNRVRAILCSRCNCGLGWFDDDPESLRRAALYLEKNT